MKKVLKTASKYVFGAFGIAVLALLMSLTYSALARVFPDNLVNRAWGLVMFDIAAMCWALAFVFGSESTGQYATAAIGFVVAFLGTLGMVAAEVILSSGQIEAGDIGKWMVYGFIVVTALHAALLYAHHATAPDIHEKINVGIARGEIVTEAIQQAAKQLDEQKSQLAYTIHQDIVSQVKRDLGLIPADPQMPIIPAQPKRTYEQVVMPLPVAENGCDECGGKNGKHYPRCTQWKASQGYPTPDEIQAWKDFGEKDKPDAARDPFREAGE